MLKPDALPCFQLTKLVGSDTPHQRRAPWNLNQIRAYWICISEIISQGGIRLKLTKQDYKRMSYRVKTRNPNQCRIFHLRMTKIIGNIQLINNFFRNRQHIDTSCFYPSFQKENKCSLQRKERRPLNQLTNSSYEKRTIENEVKIETKQEAVGVIYLAGIKLYDEYTWIDEIEEFVTSLGNKSWLEEIQ